MMDDLIKKLNGIKTNSVCYVDTDSLKIEKKTAETKETGCVGYELGQGNMILVLVVRFMFCFWHLKSNFV